MEALVPGKTAPVCEECGSYDAVAVGDRWLCVDCYAIAGSSCAPGPEESDSEGDKKTTSGGC